MRVKTRYATSNRRRPEDASFYTDGDGHSWAATVTHGDSSIHVYADGEMKLLVWAEDGTIDVVRTCEDLVGAGIGTDAKLAKVTGRSEWVNNSWFDLYDGETGDHLDAVCHTLTEAINLAKENLRSRMSVK